jgi:hypothetical protein
LPWDPAPIFSDQFKLNFEKCDTFVLEYGDPWITNDRDKENLYNKLSKGNIAPPIRGEDLQPFTKALQEEMYGKGKTIVLEQSPVSYVPNYSLVTSELEKGRIDQAAALYRTETAKLADTIARRDEELVTKIIEPLLGSDGAVFSFRGLLHGPHMRCLLKRRSIQATCIRYPVDYVLDLDERITGAITLGELVQDIEILRRFYVMIAANVKRDVVERMAEQELRTEISKLVGKH